MLVPSLHYVLIYLVCYLFRVQTQSLIDSETVSINTKKSRLLTNPPFDPQLASQEHLQKYIKWIFPKVDLKYPRNDILGRQRAQPDLLNLNQTVIPTVDEGEVQNVISSIHRVINSSFPHSPPNNVVYTIDLNPLSTKKITRPNGLFSRKEPNRKVDEQIVAYIPPQRVFMVPYTPPTNTSQPTILVNVSHNNNEGDSGLIHSTEQSTGSTLQTDSTRLDPYGRGTATDPQNLIFSDITTEISLALIDNQQSAEKQIDDTTVLYHSMNDDRDDGVFDDVTGVSEAVMYDSKDNNEKLDVDLENDFLLGHSYDLDTTMNESENAVPLEGISLSHEVDLISTSFYPTISPSDSVPHTYDSESPMPFNMPSCESCEVENDDDEDVSTHPKGDKLVGFVFGLPVDIMPPPKNSISKKTGNENKLLSIPNQSIIMPSDLNSQSPSTKFSTIESEHKNDIRTRPPIQTISSHYPGPPHVNVQFEGLSTTHLEHNKHELYSHGNDILYEGNGFSHEADNNAENNPNLLFETESYHHDMNNHHSDVHPHDDGHLHDHAHPDHEAHQHDFDHTHSFHHNHFPDQHLTIVASIPPAPSGNKGLESTLSMMDVGTKRLIDVQNNLAFRIFRHISHNTEGNMLFSPFSLASSLSLLFLGTRGISSESLNRVLPLDELVEFNPHLLFRNIISMLVSNQRSQEVAMVTQLLIKKEKGKVLDFFRSRASFFYKASVDQVSFTNIGDLAKELTNQWVGNQTEGRTINFIDKPIHLNPSLSIMMANTFTSEWQRPDWIRQTEMNFIKLPRHRRLVKVPAIRFIGETNIGYDSNLDATTAELPFSGRKHSLVIILPGKINEFVANALPSLEDKLNSYTWSGLLKNMLSLEAEIEAPIFSHKSYLNLTATLKDLGLDPLFENCDFSGINGLQDLALGDAYQVNSITIKRSLNSKLPIYKQLRPKISFNRDFMYIVRHNPTGLILHMGKYVSPFE